jgi:hypothetical protein
MAIGSELPSFASNTQQTVQVQAQNPRIATDAPSDEKRKEYSPEVRPPREWRVILMHLNQADPTKPIPEQTWRNWTNGNAQKVRVIRFHKFKQAVHCDEFPQWLATEKLRDEFFTKHKHLLSDN